MKANSNESLGMTCLLSDAFRCVELTCVGVSTSRNDATWDKMAVGLAMYCSNSNTRICPFGSKVRHASS